MMLFKLSFCPMPCLKINKYFVYIFLIEFRENLLNYILKLMFLKNNLKAIDVIDLLQALYFELICI